MTASKVAPEGGEARARGESARAPRVLVVTNMWPTPERPSYGTFVAAQVDSLRAAGLELEVLVIRGDRNPATYLTSIARVRQRARAMRADIVHAHYGLAGWTASWQPRPMVVSFCGTDLLGAPAPSGATTVKSRMAMALSQLAAAHADTIICKSENLRQALREPRDRERALVIPNGVDLRHFSPGDQAAARRRLGLREGAPLVLFPYSAQSSNKRVALARTAVEIVQATLPDASLAEVSGVPHNRMPDYYRAADCLILTSRSEGSPNAVKEAIACALPVVSVDVGDVRRWLDPVPGCEIVEDDPAALAGAIVAVLEQRRRIDASAVLPHLDQAAIARRLLEVYQAMIPA
ncbi:MAG TPA: glycosyltransferase family 4 protein [Gemmatimonadales bacterium]|nr:glycosyltransferase family 4 protein [Gemmatimonadales bacterium]